MSRLTGVLDAEMIIGLVKGEVFDLLPQLYRTVFVPPRVNGEIIVQGAGRPGADELAQALGVWITAVTPAPHQIQPFAATLSLADRQVLAVAQAEAVDHVLSNDEGLIREASRHGLTCLRVTDLLLLFKSQGLVPAVRPVLDRMIQRGYGIRADRYHDALQAAGE